MTSSEAVLDGAIADLRGETPQVRETLSALGRLLGAALIDPPRNLLSFATAHLETGASDIVEVASALVGVDVPLVHVAVARILALAPSAVLVDDVATGAPGYELVDVGIDEQIAAPNDLAAFVPAAEGFGFDSVLVLTWEHGREKIALIVRRHDHERARAALSGLLSRARGIDNFYRGRTLQVTADKSIEFRPIAASTARRCDVVHAKAVWDEIDANVQGLVRHGELLAAAGLGASRGLLVVGPPGVGKTALCRVVADELPPGTTVLVVDAGITARGLGLLYDSLAQLAPAVVFLDDIDLLAGDRRGGTGGETLRELLTHLDGFAPAAPVLTVATTNVVDAIDPALIRAGRFDCLIEIKPPDRGARELILQRYLRAFGTFDHARLAGVTDGATGSDLREVVRRAVLERGADLTDADLFDVVATGRWRPAPSTGQYL